MTDNIKETAESIRNMTIRGAGRIARTGASALGDLARNYKGTSLDEFKDEVKESADILIASRPTAVSLWNGVKSTIRGIGSTQTLEEAKELVRSNADEFVSISAKAVDTIAKIGANRIKSGDVVLTHCNSSAAIGVLKEAHRQGKEMKVYATESRPWRQGILTVNELSDAGIDTTLIIDSAVRSVMNKVDKVFVGADTITSHGALINKIGTSQIALAAHEARVQFYVCSETYKFSSETIFGDMVTIEERDVDEVVKEGEIPEGVKIFNPVFDSTPAAYIDAIITDVGVIHPGSVYDVMIRQLGDNMLEE
ncbi:MAG TPA: ribose 1,5-bisphosphate isomerase [Candidatus Methanomethylophilaceae archaeon]|nr:ribose 1,5-bisphosphate isomerase [Candidatus Methanomethylophilaceae archaeon]